MSHRSDTRKIIEALRRQGWRVERTRSSHIRAVPPDASRPICVTGGSPSDGRQMVKWLCDLRRSGFVWPEAPR